MLFRSRLVDGTEADKPVDLGGLLLAVPDGGRCFRNVDHEEHYEQSNLRIRPMACVSNAMYESVLVVRRGETKIACEATVRLVPAIQ